jgi:thiosulfate/3-mercaptopyruvate sulfurtransferase
MTNYLNPDVLVDTKWLAQHLTDTNVRIVECDTDTTLYGKGHIRGAVSLDCQSDLVDTQTRDFLGRRQFEELAGRMGIADDTTVVFYGDQQNMLACYAYWVFRVYGHDKLRLLNGGRDHWIKDGQTFTREMPVIKPTKFRAKDQAHEFRALREDVLRHIGNPDAHRPKVKLDGRALIDDRTPAEFDGQFRIESDYPPRFMRTGHIPGAANIPYTDLLRADGTFKSGEEIERLLVAKGITPDKDVVVYTRIGERSSVMWFLLHELLGYKKVRNYDGSWTEWGNMVGMPIESASVVPIPPRTATGRELRTERMASA